ncbi:hypothetical protein [Streptomyces sp. Ru73]|uniref:hypothetical protein n=1 Tax=Streptomyces sp. Ru73 TaxID=2080748 RepID=UPI0011AFDD9C|nr:hypothetical protein [Streptomyces sp. Ru73]
MVLLTAMLHLLACAHGPTPTTAGRVDTPLAVTYAPACEQGRASYDRAGSSADGNTDGSAGGSTGDWAGERAAPGSGGEALCGGEDELTMKPPRSVAPAAPAVQTALAVEYAVPPPSGPVPAGASPKPSASAPPNGQARARLGVWRN